MEEILSEDLYDRMDETEGRLEVLEARPAPVFNDQITPLVALVGILIGVMREKELLAPSEVDSILALTRGVLPDSTDKTLSEPTLASVLAAAKAIKGDPLD